MSGPRVVVAGGGPGGVEAVLALHDLAGDRIDLELLSADGRFVYRPWSVVEPFGIGHVVEVDLEALAADRNLRFTRGRVEGVDAAARLLATDGGAVRYDVLVLALGGRQVPAIPGALTFRGPRDVATLREGLERRCDHPGARVAFIANASAYWPLPAYELALMTRRWGEGRGTPVEVSIVTAEARPLEAFGPENSALVGELLRSRGIAVHTGTVVDSVADGRVLETAAGSIPADLAVALPALTGPSLPGLPQDAGGFVPVDDHCRVRDTEDVFAIGDMTARDLKQGGLATQQADVAAAAVARSTGVVCETPPYDPVLRAVLLTGGDPLYLRHPAAPVDERPSSERFDAPWWPPHKIAGRHLSPFLATHADMVSTSPPADPAS